MAGKGAKAKGKAAGAEGGKRKRKEKKDPNAPKRALSAFFCFCGEERAKVKAKHPSYSVGDVAKELGKRWEACPNRSKYEALANKDKERYAKEIAAYKKGGGSPAKASSSKGPAAKKSKKAAPPPDEDDEEEEEEDDESDWTASGRDLEVEWAGLRGREGWT